MGEAKRQATKAAGAAEDVADSKGFQLAARAGYIAAGLLHLLIGIIALRIATGGSGNADQSGALQQLAAGPGGRILLWACFLGCIALALFQLSEVFFGAKRVSGNERTKERLKSGGTAVVYAALAVAFGRYALGGSSDSGQSAQSTTASLMSHPAGAALLIAVGIGLLAAGGYFAYSGVTKRFAKNLSRLPSGEAGSAVRTLGTVGYIAKGVALAVLGFLLILAAVRNNPEESTGLDGALKTLAGQPFGIWILGAVAVGLICYGLFLMVRSRYQRM
ncbi:DUF1206 domain-containing protein [Arthrobacter sp. TMN-37]